METNLSIEKKEIKFIRDYLSGKTNPVELDEVAYQIALFKTQDNRAHKVKIYNPDCEYKVNDLIYKEYPGKIPIGSKKYIEIEEGIVLKVVEVKTRFGLEEVMLSYEGTSEFKKYLQYLERQKIELLLPHKQQKPPAKPEYLPVETDPRQQQDPLEKKDFLALKRKLAGALHREPDIAFISNKVLLTENLKPIESEVFNKIKDFLTESKQSETTEFFVENFVRVKADDPSFAACCFALNYHMSRDYKIDFQQTRMEGWGKWNLISVIYYMKKNSLVSEENPLLNTIVFSNKKNILQRRRKFEEGIFVEGTTRYYLTQREIYAGAVRLKSAFFESGESIEIELVDGKTKKSHLLYYYSDESLLLGFKEIFDRYKALQAMILTFDPQEDGRWQFNIRITKKGTIADKIVYDPEKKAFKVTEEKIASPVFVNKAMYLESDILKAVYDKIDEYRNIETLNELIHKIFLEFGVKERNYEIHFLRLYHILDLIYPIDLKLLEEVILSNNEFIPADKLVGVFYLDSTAVTAIEEEEFRRKASVRDESKKKRDDERRKKQDEERQLQEEIKKKREERRRKREEEMWQKERLRKEREERKALEQKKRKEAQKRKKPAAPPTQATQATKPMQPSAERVPREKERTRPTVVSRTPAAEINKPPVEKQISRPAATPRPEPFKSQAKPEPPLPIAELPAKEPSHKKAKKLRTDEEQERLKLMKVPKRPEKRPVDETLSEDEIKSQIQLELLKEKMSAQKQAQRKIEKEKEVAYKDEGGAFGGILASKLDQIVKKDDSKSQAKEKEEAKKEK